MVNISDLYGRLRAEYKVWTAPTNSVIQADST